MIPSSKSEFSSCRTKEEVIEAMWCFPDCPILPETKDQQIVLDNIRAHFKLLTLWLRYRLLGNIEYHDLLHGNPDSLAVKPYADLSVATLDFCYHVYSRLRPEGVDGFEQLWGICEYSKALNMLRATGYFGDRPPRNKHQRLKGFKGVLAAYMQLEQDFPCESLVFDFEPSEHIVEILLEEAINYANVEPGDKDLKFHIRKFRQALSHYYDLTLKRRTKNFVLNQLAKTVEASKRSRGRPPKGL